MQPDVSDCRTWQPLFKLVPVRMVPPCCTVVSIVQGCECRSQLLRIFEARLCLVLKFITSNTFCEPGTTRASCFVMIFLKGSAALPRWFETARAFLWCRGISLIATQSCPIVQFCWRAYVEAAHFGTAAVQKKWQRSESRLSITLQRVHCHMDTPFVIDVNAYCWLKFDNQYIGIQASWSLTNDTWISVTTYYQAGASAPTPRLLGPQVVLKHPTWSPEPQFSWLSDIHMIIPFW